jgi:membrane protease YdiL (CAAX protease family)
MSRWRRFLMFPLTRIIVAIVVIAVPQIGVALAAHALGLELLMVSAAALTAATALLALYVVGVVIERRRPDELGFPAHGLAAATVRGFGLGTAVFASVVLLMSVAGFAHVAAAPAPPYGAVALSLLTFLFVGLGEEVAVRGLIFRVLEEWVGSWGALVLSALLFGAVHLGNAHATVWAGVAIALEAGLLLAAMFMLTRSLVFVSATHWAWNFMEGPVFGCAVSGGKTEGLLHTTTSGPDTWTGGEFGPEASVIAVLVCSAVTLVVLVLAVRRGQVRPPAWRAGAQRGQRPA